MTAASALEVVMDGLHTAHRSTSKRNENDRGLGRDRALSFGDDELLDECGALV